MPYRLFIGASLAVMVALGIVLGGCQCNGADNTPDTEVNSATEKPLPVVRIAPSHNALDFVVPEGAWVPYDLGGGQIGLMGGEVSLHINIYDQIVSGWGFRVVGVSKLKDEEAIADVKWDANAGEGRLIDHEGNTMPETLRFPLVLAGKDQLTQHTKYEDIWLPKHGARLVWYEPWNASPID